MRLDKKYALFLISIAYIFSVAVRLYYYFWAKNIPEFLWNKTLMINNVDGYYYAAGAYELLHNSHVIGDLNPIYSFPSILTAIIVKLFPFLSLDQVILWMPAIFGSLVVIPVYLIGRSLKNDFLGFGAALIAGIAWSYYNRTMIGYYDTDMLIVVLLTFIVWSIIEWFVNKNEKMLFFTPIFIFLLEAWYPQSRTLILAVIVMSVLYLIVEYIIRKNIKSFLKENRDNVFYIIILSISIFGFKWYINAIIVILLLFLYKNKRELLFENKNFYILIGISILGILFSGTLNILYSKILSYILRDDIKEGLHYFSVVKTIREASGIPYSLVAKRISSNEILFGLSAIGYILMLIRWPVFVITLPLVGLGIIAHKAGLRFTIYAVPFFALGLVYLGFKISELINIKEKKFHLILPLFLVGISIYYNIKHVVLYKVPTTFINPEVATLNKLSHIAKPQDYVVSWWDYGYPIRYYSHTKTLIDGGKHSGEVNFPVSFILTHNQVAAANMARIDVELTDKIETLKELNKYDDNRSLVQIMMDKYGYKNPNEFLSALNNPNFKLPKKTRDIYLYLPFRMADIYPTVAVFSSINLLTGKIKQPVIISTMVRGISPQGIIFTNGFILDSKGLLHIQNQLIPINSIYITDYKNNKFIVQKNIINPTSNLYVLWYRPLNKVLIVDNKIFNSTYVQMFFLQKYDKKLFEPVILNPYVKIYKLKK